MDIPFLYFVVWMLGFDAQPNLQLGYKIPSLEGCPKGGVGRSPLTTKSLTPNQLSIILEKLLNCRIFLD